MKPKKTNQRVPPGYQYAREEYGAAPEQVDAAASRALREIAADRKAGKLVKFTGKLKRSKPGPKPAKVFTAVADSEGGLPLSDELAKAMRCKIGDKYACWKEGKGWLLVFPRTRKSQLKIPKHAFWGKVEPALPEISVTLSAPIKATRARRKKSGE